MLDTEMILRDIDLDEEELDPIYMALCTAFSLQRVTSKRHYERAIKILIRLTEYSQTSLISPAEKKQVLKYADALGLLVEDYETSRYSRIGKGVSGAHVLEHLMQEHGLRQVDLRRELGGQSVVSEILSGARSFNLAQIRALARRFKVSPTVFFDSD